MIFAGSVLRVSRCHLLLQLLEQALGEYSHEATALHFAQLGPLRPNACPLDLLAKPR